ncbi:TROVE domain-containing protein [Fimbriiglobus ruber]|uniref:Prophage Clp protease-like protein n=1 Tax=Fimbriiglobus ruber TaxID=1908690 RepID=A0A225DZK5_9BACT|nr:TROVE domain-containing protein [Fimbriiglobus ruber]OWK46722.1 Prophage Clp protease-like protein [Fimbriiglobus ruber]
MRYVKHVQNKVTPQNEPVPGKPMVANSAGGYSFAVDDWVRLDRFLVLGCEGGSYYASERALLRENAEAVVRCVQADGVEAVRRIAAVSVAGRAPKNDPAVFALALAAAHGTAAGKTAAYAAVPAVCRTGTHLFQFAAASDGLRGWGRGLRQAVADWYLKKAPRDLAYQMTKYQQRDGWGHRDLLRLAHPKTSEPTRNDLFAWAVGKKGDDYAETLRSTVTPDADLAPLYALEAAKRATSEDEIVRLIRNYRLVREGVSTQFLTSAKVWEALLADMPLTALLRNLATMTRVGLLASGADAVRKVVANLTDAGRLAKARVHPLALLVALKTYERGKSVRGDGTWTPVREVVDALDKAFYLAFRAIEPTGKRWLLALDVSGSMGGPELAGMPGITPRVGSAAMALVTAATEPEHQIMAFSHELVPLDIGPRMKLATVLKKTSNLSFGGTDCALPMLYAAKNRVSVDMFVVYTDSETWFGQVHPFQALTQYRDKTGIAAKLVVVGMVANKFTIADPGDAGMLDVVGFDATAPAVIADFART